MEIHRTVKDRPILNLKNKVGGLTLHDLKTCYRATVINTGGHGRKDRQVNGTELRVQTEINSHVDGQVTSRGCQDNLGGKRMVFPANGPVRTGQSHEKQ